MHKAYRMLCISHVIFHYNRNRFKCKIYFQSPVIFSISALPPIRMSVSSGRSTRSGSVKISKSSLLPALLMAMILMPYFFRTSRSLIDLPAQRRGVFAQAAVALGAGDHALPGETGADKALSQRPGHIAKAEKPYGPMFFHAVALPLGNSFPHDSTTGREVPERLAARADFCYNLTREIPCRFDDFGRF